MANLTVKLDITTIAEVDKCISVLKHVYTTTTDRESKEYIAKELKNLLEEPDFKRR